MDSQDKGPIMWKVLLYHNIIMWDIGSLVAMTSLMCLIYLCISRIMILLHSVHLKKYVMLCYGLVTLVRVKFSHILQDHFIGMIAPVPVKWPCRIWINVSGIHKELIDITTTKQSTTTHCTYSWDIPWIGCSAIRLHDFVQFTCPCY